MARQHGEAIMRMTCATARGNRLDYPVETVQDQLKHFVIWTTTPDRPFGPHKHDGAEFWYILDGEATVHLDGDEYSVGPGDLVYLAPYSYHGLSSTSRCRWICLG